MRLKQTFCIYANWIIAALLVIGNTGRFYNVHIYIYIYTMRWRDDWEGDCRDWLTWLWMVRCISFHIFTSLIFFFTCICVLFHSYCMLIPMRKVFGRTLVHEFLILYTILNVTLYFSTNNLKTWGYNNGEFGLNCDLSY